MTDFEGLLRTLADAEVEFIRVGGAAAAARGAARLPLDVDIVYSRGPANLERFGGHPFPAQALPKRRAAGFALSVGQRDVAARLELHADHRTRRSRAVKVLFDYRQAGGIS
jgi:hypothetical protein